MTQSPARERLRSLAGSFVLAIILVARQVHRRTERDRPLATVTDINTRRTPGEE